MKKTALPIDIHIPDILDRLLSPLPFILTSSAGSGKTTRVPYALLEKLSDSLLNKNEKIIVILPKRIAAIGAALRVCEENSLTLGQEVGYQVRFDKQHSDKTQLIFMTEGIFLNKISQSDFFDSVKYIFIDEFHERSSSMDIILGLCFEKYVLEQKLKITVMSATLNHKILQSYFEQFESIDIKAPPYQLDIHYSNKSQRLECDSAFYENLVDTMKNATTISQKDILVFLPGAREINRALQQLQHYSSRFKIELAYGAMGIQAQKKLLHKDTIGRRIILTTNIAESSITLPDVDCVVDSGLEKRLSLDSKLGFSKLVTSRVSQFSAKQRQGRASRTQNGHCFKMWSKPEDGFLNEATPPQICTSLLFEECLLLISLGHNPLHFSWLTEPKKERIERSLNQLKRWNLIKTEYPPDSKDESLSSIHNSIHSSTRNSARTSAHSRNHNSDVNLESNIDYTLSSALKSFSHLSLALTEIGQQILNVPLSIEQALLFYNLITKAPDLKDVVCDYFAKIDSIDFNLLNTSARASNESDIDKILVLALTPPQEKAKKQLLEISSRFKNPSNRFLAGTSKSKTPFNDSAVNQDTFKNLSDDSIIANSDLKNKKDVPAFVNNTAKKFSEVLLEIFAANFPERIIFKKSSTTGTSIYGRGVEFSSNALPSDSKYFLALEGFEKSSAVTYLQVVAAIDKNLTEKLLNNLIKDVNEINFDVDKELFYSISKKMLGTLVIQQGPRSYLKKEEVENQWKSFVNQQPEFFLNFNLSFAKFKKILNFLNNKADELKIDPVTLGTLSNMLSPDGPFYLNLCTALLDTAASFEDFKNTEVFYYLPHVLNEKLLQIINEFPDYIKLPSGRKCYIDYEDPKAPIISAKVQDFFGMNKSPTLFNHQITITIQLLAPNMRPTQITKDLEYFWQNSYHEIKKELKARYPKHPWPDDPLNP